MIGHRPSAPKQNPTGRSKAAINALAIVLMSLAAQAQPPVVMSERDCLDCHGENGVSQDSNVPILAGQSPYVVADQLFAFQEGDRVCRELRVDDPEHEPTDHCLLVEGLDESNLEAIGDFFSQLTFVPQSQNFDQTQVERGEKIHDVLCQKCHTEGGSRADDDAGLLAGQWAPYLRQALGDFVSGARVMPEKKVAKIEKLTAEDVEALVHYYASIGQP